MSGRLLILALCLTAAAAADAQAPTLPALTAPRQARVDSLAARALSALETLPPTERRGAASRLADAFASLGRCSLAEPLVRSWPRSAASLGLSVHPEVLESDKACADRLITLYAEAVVPGETERAPWDLYIAGALWRRIGEEEKAEQAIERAERALIEDEARDPDGGWACHGGNCLSRLWQTRLWALGRLRGSYSHRDQLRWLGTLALSQWHAREARQPGVPYIGQQVFEELLPEAIDAGDDRLAQLLAEPTPYGYPKAYVAQRMRLLFDQGRIAEAIELWPVAQGAFQAPITPAVFRANVALFHQRRELLGTRLGRGPGELLSLLAAVWVERGEPERAREALATARAHHESVRGHDWDLQYVQRLRAVEAMLDGGGDPVRWLHRNTSPTDSLGRDYAFRELAGLLAATHRQPETRRAIAAIRDPRIRRGTLVELPCRAAYGGDAAANFAVALARGHIGPRSASRDEASQFGAGPLQTFRCLVGAHRGEAAIAYARAVEDPELRLGLFIERPLDSGIPDEAALRGRFADLAFSDIAARNLWADRRVSYMAADFERAGDFSGVDRVLARVRGEARIAVYERLLRVYAPGPFY
ncbi:MAG TPA: hypothetical protein VEW04_11605 [Allosphingosinicella sp.]|nr:hypothetical protein [Allosphingosinicella sp.]